MPLEAFGWTDDWQSKFSPYASTVVLPGRVVGEHRTHYRVATNDAEVSAEITGSSDAASARATMHPLSRDRAAVETGRLTAGFP